MADSLSRQVLRSVLTRREGGIPARIREKATLQIMDTVGIALAAHRGDPVAPGAAASLYSGVKGGQCRVIGAKEGLPPALAAFANSALGHTMDYDDIHDLAGLHPTSSTLPAALAAADICDATGQAVVEAVALADELMCRLGLAVGDEVPRPMTRWFLSQLFGYMVNSVAAGLVMDFSEDELVSAFGLGYMQAAGCKEEAFAGGSNARAVYPAFGSMGGVHAAMLTRGGVIGPSTALEGVTGFYRNYLGVDPATARLEVLLDTESWVIGDIDAKPWPSCRLSHPYVAAVLSIRDHILSALNSRSPVPSLQSLDRIVARVDPLAAQLCRPMETRRRPRTLQDAKYSIPFMVAFTLSKGRVDLRSLTAAALDDAEVLALAERVEVVEDLPAQLGIAPGYVTVFFPGGSVESGACRPPHLGAEEITRKFMDCCAFAGLPDASAKELRDRLLHLEEIRVADLFAGIPPVA